MSEDHLRICVCFLTDDGRDGPPPPDQDLTEWARDWLAVAGVRVEPDWHPPYVPALGTVPVGVDFHGATGEAQVLTYHGERVILLTLHVRQFDRMVAAKGSGTVLRAFRDLCDDHWPRAAFIQTMATWLIGPEVRSVVEETYGLVVGRRLEQEEWPVVFLDSVLEASLPPDASPLSPRDDLRTRAGGIRVNRPYWLE